ncbi:MAG TPA: hypothetical protein VH186_07090 [Chloroflexia bacterium]|nr:hypothetical protein [Chloroflexia bacterium]
MPKNNVLPKGEPFTTVPDYFLCHVMTELSASELRVMLYIYLHTLGYGKLSDSISYEQFLHGIITRDGRRLDRGAGVSRRSLVSALVSLESKGLISRTGNGYAAATISLKLGEMAEENHSSVTIPEVASCHSPSESSESDLSLPMLMKVNPASENFSIEYEPGKNEAKNPIGKEVLQPHDEGVQNLHTVDSYEVQKLRSTGQFEVQKLHSTKESESKHENINRVQTPPAETAAINLIRNKVSGITHKEALKLVKIAYYKHGRDHSYLERLVEYVVNTPLLRNPAAVLTSLIKHDQDRTPAEDNFIPDPYKAQELKQTISAFPGSVLATDVNLINPSADEELNSLDKSNYEEVYILLTRKYRFCKPSRANYIIQVARKQGVSSERLLAMLNQALASAPGDRSACFERLFRELHTQNSYIPIAQPSRAKSGPIDFSKYAPGGKYGFLVSPTFAGSI